jgi:hypothetical protein
MFSGNDLLSTFLPCGTLLKNALKDFSVAAYLEYY